MYKETKLGVAVSPMTSTAPPEPGDVHPEKRLDSMCISVSMTPRNPVHAYAVAHITPPPLADEQLVKSDSDIKTMLPAASKTLPYPIV
jgi:hypothetical protein